jgi:hypothetical protein
MAFGFLKGRWVVRDIARALAAEGIEVSRSYVYDLLKGLGFTYKRPKLTVKSNDPNYYRKAKEVRNYKRIAPALEKKSPRSVRGRDLDRALPTGRSEVDEEGQSGDGAHPWLQQEEERIRDTLLAKEERFRLEQVREEEEQGVQAPPHERHPAREETRRQKDHPLHGPRPMSQDQEREKVHPRPQDPHDETAPEESPAAEPHRMDREQTAQIRGLLEPIIQEPRRGRREHDKLPQTT